VLPHLKEGTHRINAEAGEPGTYQIIKDGKMSVVMLRSAGYNLPIVVFPRKSHEREFVEAAKGVAKYGPVTENPGAVGTLLLKKENTSTYGLEFIQSHYMTKGNPSLKDPKYGITRNRATQYHGWRLRALRAALSAAQEEGKTVRVPKEAYIKKPGLLADINKACREAGMGAYEGADGLTILPPDSPSL